MESRRGTRAARWFHGSNETRHRAEDTFRFSLPQPVSRLAGLFVRAILPASSCNDQAVRRTSQKASLTDAQLLLHFVAPKRHLNLNAEVDAMKWLDNVAEEGSVMRARSSVSRWLV